MAVKAPPNWMLKTKVMKDTVTIRILTQTTGDWGTITEESYTDHEERCFAVTVALEDINYLPPGEFKAGDLRVFLPIMDDLDSVSATDRLVYKGETYQIYRVNKEGYPGDVYWELFARKLA